MNIEKKHGKHGLIGNSIFYLFINSCNNPCFSHLSGQLDSSRDNSSIIQRILILRNEQAKLHGYENFAAYSTSDTMAKSPDAVSSLLEKVFLIYLLVKHLSTFLALTSLHYRFGNLLKLHVIEKKNKLNNIFKIMQQHQKK